MLFASQALEANYIALYDTALLNGLHYVLCVATVCGI